MRKVIETSISGIKKKYILKEDLCCYLQGLSDQNTLTFASFSNQQSVTLIVTWVK